MIPVQVFFLIGHYIQVQSRHGPFSGFSSPYHSSLRTTPSLSRWDFVYLRILNMPYLSQNTFAFLCFSPGTTLTRPNTEEANILFLRPLLLSPPLTIRLHTLR